MIAAYLVLGAIVAGGNFEPQRFLLLIPQLAFSILLFPIVGRIVAFFDRVRLFRIKVIG